MKVFSTHFVFKGKSDYKDLAPVFKDILKALLEEIDQMPEEDEIFQMYIDMNMVDIERNRKPEGYNRKGKMRLIFPLDRKEFYLKTYNKATDMSGMTELISGLLTSAGVKYEILYNDKTDFE